MVFSGAVPLAAGWGLGGNPSAGAGSGPASPAASTTPALTAPTNAPVSSGPSAHADPTPQKVTQVFTVSPTVGNVSTPVTFSGSGYAHSVAFTVSYYNAKGITTDACSGVTTSTGTYTCSVDMPPLPTGEHVFTGEDAKGHTQTATFTVAPKLILSPTSGIVGSPVTVTGTGFGGHVSGEGTGTVKVYKYSLEELNWSGGPVCGNVLLTTTQYDKGQRFNLSASGGFNCTLTISPTPGGKTRFSAVDNASHQALAFFTVLSQLSVGPTQGPDLTNVTFIGTGFGAVVPVEVTWSGGLACRVVTLGTGGFDCNYRIPSQTAGGSFTFTANDTVKNVASTTFIVTYIAAAPSNGPVGTAVVLSAAGFAEDSPLTIDFDGTLACAVGLTNSVGAFSCDWVIPEAVAGVHTFSAIDGTGTRATSPFVVQPTLTATPGYGTPGTAVTFNGTGFAAVSLVKVTWAGGLACSATTSKVGAFACDYTIPGATAGRSYPFNATDAVDDVASTPFVVTYLSLSPSTGPTTTLIALSGAGFVPSTSVSVTWGATTVCTAAVTSTGTFSCLKSYEMKNATDGAQTFVAQDLTHAANFANATFTVTPAVLETPKSGVVGTSITFSGTGFAAGSLMTVSWSGGTACTTITDSQGTFGCLPYVLPPTVTGAHLFTAEDAAHNTAHVSFTVGPSLSASPGSGPVAAPVDFTGAGFDASTGITLTWTGGTVCSGTTNASGSYGCTYDFPAEPYGSYVVTATDSESQTANTTYAVRPLLTDNPSTGPNGTLVDFTGSGFQASKPITVSWPSSTTACTAESSTAGSFSCEYAIPPTPGGSYLFSASDTKYTASTTFTVTPGLTVTPGRGLVGTEVTFTGAGFEKNGVVTVTYGAGQVACTTTALPSGGFTCSFTIPPTTSGTILFTAADKVGDERTVDFTVVAGLVPSPASGPVGTLLTLNGSGFSAGRSVSVTSTGLGACTATSNASGSFSCALTVPPATFGAHEFTATDGVYTAEANFSIVPHLDDVPSSGLVGTVVTFTGTGYGREVGVSVSWTDGAACSNTTTVSGGFGCTYTIPTGTPGGVYAFTGADGDGDSAIATFTVTTSLSATPSHGEAGTSVTFQGIGFAASSTATVTWAGGTACSSATSATGTFSCSYAIPSGTAGGTYTFTAKDLKSDSASTTFVVTFLDDSPTGGIAGSSTAFSAGGFTPLTAFSISWADGEACSGSTTATGAFSCSYSIPVYTSPGAYTFTGTDGSLSALATFTVFGLPSVSTPAPTRAAGDVGQSVTFSTVASGGSGTYASYTWSESLPALGCALVSAASVLCTPTAPGNFTVTVLVTDSAGDSSPTATSANYPVSSDPTIGTPTWNVTGADVGQPVKFSVGTSGGSGGNTFAWSGLPAGCGGSGASISCSPTAEDLAGSVHVTVTDSNGYSAVSGTLAIVIDSDPTVTTPTATRASADVGQSVTFSTTSGGGSGGLTYSWAGLPSGCAGTGLSVTCAPTAPEGLTAIHVTVTDSNGYKVTSGNLEFLVYADPTVKTPSTGGKASVDVGQSVTFTTVAGNGSGGYAYVWNDLPAGCSGTGPTVTCSPTSPSGTLDVTVTVTDSNGLSVTSASLAFTVFAAPVASAPRASSAGADLNQPVEFSAVLTGGAGPIRYVWHGLPAGCAGTTASIECTVTDASELGVYAIGYTAFDANGLNSTSPTLSFRFDPDPTVTPPTASRSSADVGQSVTFSVDASGGAGDFSYDWQGLPAGCAPLDADVIVCSPTAPVARTNISVNVTDANGYGVTSGVLVYSVYAAPSVAVPVPSAVSRDVGQTVTFTAVVKGGSGGFTYTWTGLPAGCAGSTAVVDCPALSTANTYLVGVEVTDSNGLSDRSLNLTFVVYADPTVSTPMATAPGVDVGQTVMFSASASGGSGNLTVSWAGLPSGCTGTTNLTVTCKPTSALAATAITVTVTDPNGFSVTSPALTYTVSATLQVSASSSPSSVLEGKGTTFGVAVTGGAGPFVYAWSGLPSGCSASPSATISCTPSAAGTYTVTVTVTDANKATAKATTTLSVGASFLGLPAVEGEALVAGGVLAVIVVGIVAAVLVSRRRRRNAAPLPWEPRPSSPTAPAPSESPAPQPWTPPPPAVPANEEPAPWELPPQEPGPEEPGSPPAGGTAAGTPSVPAPVPRPVVRRPVYDPPSEGRPAPSGVDVPVAEREPPVAAAPPANDPPRRFFVPRHGSFGGHRTGGDRAHAPARFRRPPPPS